MKRNYSLDLMRIFLCLCVITLHSIGYFGIENNYVSSLLIILLIQADGVFYMLSGYFNLEKDFNNSSDIKMFYKNKIIYILLPFVGFLLVWAIWDYVHVNNSFDILDCLNIFYEQFVDTASDSHMWFMYPLFGLLLSSPFLSKMLHNMDKKELKVLLYVALGWNAVSCYLCYDLGYDFRFLAWFLEGWLIYYVAGYYYRHVASEEKKSKWIILGLLGFVITCLGVLFLDHFEGATDIQPMFTLYCMGCLAFFDRFIKINNEKVQKVIVFLSRNTFLIYLYHMRAMEFVLRKFALPTNNLANGLIVVFGTFIIALIASVITNLVMKPVQKFIDKHWIIK